MARLMVGEGSSPFSYGLTFSSKLMIMIGIVTYMACNLITAPYGRYSTKQGWGFLVPAKLSWFFMESPNLWIPLIVYRYLGVTECCDGLPNRILTGMFVMHYIQRSIIYPVFRLKGSHHQPTPISISLLAFSFCSWNGMNQALSLLVVTSYPDNWLSDSRFLFGFLLFSLGFIINVHADSNLLRLKSSRSKPQNLSSVAAVEIKCDGHRDSEYSQKQKSLEELSEARNSYKIPRGGLFELVSCANYFGEIIEWTGFAIACWSLPALAFAIYTFSNLAPRAHKHHEWYKKNFKDYPKKRKALVPFLW